MILEPSFFIQPATIKIFIKVSSLIVIGMLALSALMLATKIRSFNKILFLPPNSGGGLMQKVAIGYFFVIGFLFLLALLVL